MNSSNGAGTALGLKKEKKPKKFKATIWVPCKKKARRASANRLLLAMSSPPTTTSTISATRQGAMVTLTYTLHASQPMNYVIVTYNMGSNPIFVSQWSADLHLNPSQDAYLPPTVASVSTPLPVTIEVRYSTNLVQNVLAASTNV